MNHEQEGCKKGHLSDGGADPSGDVTPSLMGLFRKLPEQDKGQKVDKNTPYKGNEDVDCDSL